MAERRWVNGVLALLQLSVFCRAWKGDTSAADCSQIERCDAITVGCGWCWDSSTTVGQKHGARPGGFKGPSDGGHCDDWTVLSFLCGLHVDCPSLPNCENILGTKCGWCQATNTSYFGSRFGPLPPFTCDADAWIWDSSLCPIDYSPQQVHLAYGNTSDSMMVTWATANNSDSVVQYWKPDGAVMIAEGTTTYFGPDQKNEGGKHYIHRVLLQHLDPNTTYSYVAVSDGLKSKQFQFTTQPNASDYELRLIVFGDLGRYGGGFALRKLEQEAKALPAPHAFIHVGDFAYNLDDAGGLNGDAFLSRIENIAARFPYEVCPGNHEIEKDHKFHHYRNRFSMPGYQTNSGFDMWYSFNVQKVHFVSYSTEVYFARAQDIPRQYEWLAADLKKANLNRAAQPWIVAFGHRPMYCSNADGDDCTRGNSTVRAGLEKLFHEMGVDLVIEAHEHSYERLWPVYNNVVTQKNYINPKAMVHVVSGAAGCNEDYGVCVNTILGPRGPWSAYRTSAPGTYSYMHMRVANDTHLYLDSYQAEAEKVEDSFWLVQERHGPRTDFFPGERFNADL